MQRHLEPEWLDDLPPADPRAARSRKDLERINAWMNNAGLMADALRQAMNGRALESLIEIGAGDGQFLWGVSGRLAAAWPEASATLLDRQDVVPRERLAAFGGLGWRARLVRADVVDWLRQAPAQTYDALVANLFLHHFRDSQLAEMLGRIAGRTRVCVALEPRRSALTLAFSRCLRVIGCNEVTRHDAPISVRAGFAGTELSRLWPADGNWSLQEGAAGWFSHLFVARRRDNPTECDSAIQQTANPHYGLGQPTH